jgi:sec-independent protein translocase protein TatC
VLFYAGAAFAYFVVFPLVFAFFTGTAPEGVAVMTDISRYLDFVLTLFFAFGAAFEVPVFTVLLVWTGMATQEGLREKRPYVIVGAFVIGMLLTPPDIISQTLLAVPVWLLFELGVYFSGWFIKQREEVSDSADGSSVAHYKPMSDSEMEAELDRMDKEDKS